MARGFQKLASRGAAMLQPEAGMVVEGWGDRSDAVSSAGLLLVTHGSHLGNDLAIGKLAKALSPDFSEVAFCVLRGRPVPADTLSGMSASLVHIVPLLMASGRIGGHVLRSLLPRPKDRVSACIRRWWPSGPGRTGLRQYQPGRRAEPGSAPANRRHPGRSRQRAEPRLSIRALPPGEHGENLRVRSR